VQIDALKTVGKKIIGEKRIFQCRGLVARGKKELQSRRKGGAKRNVAIKPLPPDDLAGVDKKKKN